MSYEGDGDDEDEEEEDVVSFGSSPALIRELTELESILGNVQNSMVSGSLQALRILREAAQKSAEHAMPLILW